MPDYSNGYIPKEWLVIFETGQNAIDGEWYHGLSPATYSKHLALVERARNRTGRTLRISDGWGAYRPYEAQVIARRVFGDGAAWPGTSSHGGFWEDQQTLAMDYSNWSLVYQGFGGQAAFFSDCRVVGLTPGMIMSSRGYPDEPWHVIDLTPWEGGLASSGSTPFPTQAQEEDMKTIKGETRPATLVAPGYVRQLSEEEAGNIGAVAPIVTGNDRQFDLWLSVLSGAVSTQPRGGMVVVTAPERTDALVGPGYYRVLNKEERQNVGALADRVVNGNARQYDLWVSMALAGQGAAFPVTATAEVTPEVVRSIAEAVAKLVGSSGSSVSDADIEKIAAETRKKFSTEPLKLAGSAG